VQRKKAGNGINAKTQRRGDAKKAGLNRDLLPIALFFPSLRLCGFANLRSIGVSKAAEAGSAANAKMQTHAGAKSKKGGNQN
jgi:hypothetical protein